MRLYRDGKLFTCAGGCNLLVQRKKQYRQPSTAMSELGFKQGGRCPTKLRKIGGWVPGCLNLYVLLSLLAFKLHPAHVIQAVAGWSRSNVSTQILTETGMTVLLLPTTRCPGGAFEPTAQRSAWKPWHAFSCHARPRLLLFCIFCIQEPRGRT